MALMQVSTRPDQPNDIESERQVLGCIIASETAFDLVSFLKPEHFFYDAHAEIYATICRMIEAGKVVNALTLAPFADKIESLSGQGGFPRGRVLREQGLHLRHRAPRLPGNRESVD